MGELRHATIAQIEANHRSLLSLCDALEAVADSLPGRVDHSLCRHLAQSLTMVLQRAQQVEERLAFPLLETWQSGGVALADALTRLRQEHQTDQSYAADIEEVLRAYGDGWPVLSADAAGFMLRGFFEALRRHIAFEQQLLIPLLRLRLGA